MKYRTARQAEARAGLCSLLENIPTAQRLLNAEGWHREGGKNDEAAAKSQEMAPGGPRSLAFL